MKYGNFIGIIDNKVLVYDCKEMVMEDFMQKYKIMETQDIFLFPPTATKEFQNEFWQVLSEIWFPSSKSLMRFIFENQEKFPPMPELPAKNYCQICERNLPEPDGFGGVETKGKLLCFNCYTRYEYEKKIDDEINEARINDQEDEYNLKVNSLKIT